MGDVNHGGVEALVQGFDLGPQLHAQLGIEVGERLIEQKNLRVAYHRPAHGHALTLAAGERSRIAAEQLIDTQHAGDVLNLVFLCRLVDFFDLHMKGEVFRHRQMGVERVALKNHGDIAVRGIEIVDWAAVHQYRSRRQAFQPGQQAQQR